MARCVALWYGGSNYSSPDPDRDLETFNSLREAITTFQARADFDPAFPCVDDDLTEMHVFFGEEYHENGPDRVVRFGPRGGTRVERG
jgi:hypothetical protein